MKKILTTLLLLVASTCCAVPEQFKWERLDNALFFATTITIDTNDLEDTTLKGGKKELIGVDDQICTYGVIFKNEFTTKKCYIICDDDWKLDLNVLTYNQENQTYQFSQIIEYEKFSIKYVVLIKAEDLNTPNIHDVLLCMFVIKSE